MPNGVIWTIPILLSNSSDLKKINDEIVALLNSKEEVVGWIDVEEKYKYDKLKLSEKFYGLTDQDHPVIKIL